MQNVPPVRMNKGYYLGMGNELMVDGQKAIFQKAGITAEQLNDKRTAKIVKKFMQQHR